MKRSILFLLAILCLAGCAKHSNQSYEKSMETWHESVSRFTTIECLNITKTPAICPKKSATNTIATATRRTAGSNSHKSADKAAEDREKVYTLTGQEVK